MTNPEFDIRPEEARTIVLARRDLNNFYVIFQGIRAAKKGEYNDFLELYVKKVEKYGEKWEIFKKKHKELLERIDTELDKFEIFEKLYDQYVVLLNAGQLEKAKAFRQETNIDVIQKLAWGQLNPLLKEVALAMIDSGINPIPMFR